MRRRSRRTPRARPSLMDPKQDVRSLPSCPPPPLPTMLRCCAASGRAFYPIQRPTSSSALTSLTTDRHSSSTTIRKVRLLSHPSGSLGPYGFNAVSLMLPGPNPIQSQRTKRPHVSSVRTSCPKFMSIRCGQPRLSKRDMLRIVTLTHLTGIPVDRSRSPRFCGRTCRLRVRRRRLRLRRAALQVRTQPASARRSQPG
jgi:hypothetical protein